MVTDNCSSSLYSAGSFSQACTCDDHFVDGCDFTKNVAKGVVRMFVDIIRTPISKTRPLSSYQLTHCKLARCKVIKNLWRSSSNPHKHGSLHSYVSQLLIEIIKINSRVNPLHSAAS